MSKVIIDQMDLDRIGLAMSDMQRATSAAMNTLTGIKIQPYDTSNQATQATPAQRDEVDNAKNYESTMSAVATGSKRAIPWGLQCHALDPEFVDGLLWIESQIGLNPENLVPCMKFESNINPKARNPASTASGLIQFMAGTAKNLDTTIEAIRQMDAMVQLSYVYKYFKNQRSDWSGLDVKDTYMAILWPKGIGKPDSYPIFPAATEAYRVNRGLDMNHDGMVTKAEACQRILELQKQGFEDGNVGYF